MKSYTRYTIKRKWKKRQGKNNNNISFISHFVVLDCAHRTRLLCRCIIRWHVRTTYLLSLSWHGSASDRLLDCARCYFAFPVVHKQQRIATVLVLVRRYNDDADWSLLVTWLMALPQFTMWALPWVSWYDRCGIGVYVRLWYDFVMSVEV